MSPLAAGTVGEQRVMISVTGHLPTGPLAPEVSKRLIASSEPVEGMWTKPPASAAWLTCWLLPTSAQGSGRRCAGRGTRSGCNPIPAAMVVAASPSPSGKHPEGRTQSWRDQSPGHRRDGLKVAAYAVPRLRDGLLAGEHGNTIYALIPVSTTATSNRSIRRLATSRRLHHG